MTRAAPRIKGYVIVSPRKTYDRIAVGIGITYNDTSTLVTSSSWIIRFQRTYATTEQGIAKKTKLSHASHDESTRATMRSSLIAKGIRNNVPSRKA